MKSARRQFLKGAAALTAASAVPAASGAAAFEGDSPFDNNAEGVRAGLLDHFSSLGYEQSPPATFVTDDYTFNGGLRYDDSGVPPASGQIFVQPSARVEDITQKNRHDVLPLFHILRIDRFNTQSVEDGINTIFSALTDALNLDPDRMLFVSVPALEQYRSALEAKGIDWTSQVHIRNEAAARKALDGSGYFRDPTNKNLPPQVTAGIYYCLDQMCPDTELTYPVQTNATEIGELILEPSIAAAAGFGIERLAYAQSGSIRSWEEQIIHLFSAIEAAGKGKPVPPARNLFEQE